LLLRWLHPYTTAINVPPAHIDKTSLFLGSGLILAAVLSLFVAIYPEITMRLIITLIGNLLVLFAVQALVTKRMEIERLLKVYIAGATVCALLGITQALVAKFVGFEFGRVMWALGGGPGNPVTILSIPRVTSTWLDPNIYGLFLVPAVSFIWGVSLKGWARFLILVILIAGLAVSFSRTAWLSTVTAVTATLTLYWLAPRLGKLPSTPVTGLRASFLFLIGLALAAAVPWRHIWDILVLLNPAAVEGRIDMSRIGLRYFYHSPILGMGPGNFLPVSMAFTHNSYLSILIEYGLIGGLAWFSLLALTGWRGIKVLVRCRRPALSRLTMVSLGAFAGLLVGGLSVEIQNDKFVWVVLGIITVLFREFVSRSGEEI
jgi:O-antigen ligase